MIGRRAVYAPAWQERRACVVVAERGSSRGMPLLSVRLVEGSTEPFTVRAEFIELEEDVADIRTNDQRAERAMQALLAYKANDWRAMGLGELDGDAILEAIGDILGDLHHLCDRTNPSEVRDLADAITQRDFRWDQLTDRGEYHYSEEVAEEALVDRGVTSWTVGEAGLRLAKEEVANRPPVSQLGDDDEPAAREEGPGFEASMELKYPQRRDG